MENKKLTKEEKGALWDQIRLRGECPNCKAKFSMIKGPRGGLTLNIKCSSCGKKYWVSPFRGFGAHPV